MNTPAHILLGASIFGSRDKNKLNITLAAMLGGVLPDLSLYFMAGFAMFVLKTPPNIVFDELYFSDAWQFVFSIDNSFLVWGVLFFIAVKLQKRVLIALTLAALLHLLCDITLHNDDARQHFWPMSDWRFISPLSYWDSNHHALIIAPIEGVLCAISATFLIISHHAKWFKFAVLCILVAELFVIRSWILFF